MHAYDELLPGFWQSVCLPRNDPLGTGTATSTFIRFLGRVAVVKEGSNKYTHTEPGVKHTGILLDAERDRSRWDGDVRTRHTVD